MSLSTYGETWSPACLGASGHHFACGSREGLVQVWHGCSTPDAPRKHPDESDLRFKRAWKRSAGHRADVGPLAALGFPAQSGLVLGAYAAPEGFVHGKFFRGAASVVAWDLVSGVVVWKVAAPEGQPPTVFASVSAAAVRLVHAYSEPVAGLQLALPAHARIGAIDGPNAIGPNAIGSNAIGSAEATADGGSGQEQQRGGHYSSMPTDMLLGIVPLPPSSLPPSPLPSAAPQKPPPPPLARVPATVPPGRPTVPIIPKSDGRHALAFTASADGETIAIGFSGGALAMALPLEWGGHAQPPAQHILRGQLPRGPDVAAVLLVSDMAGALETSFRCRLDGSRPANTASTATVDASVGAVTGTGPVARARPFPYLLAASADCHVSLCAARGATLLEVLSSIVVAQQPCSLAVCGSVLACGCVEGSLLALHQPPETPPPSGPPLPRAAAARGEQRDGKENAPGSADAANAAAVDAAAVDVADLTMRDTGALAGATAAALPVHEYEWRFHSAVCGSGRAREHGQAFARWACTASHERARCEEKMRERIAAASGHVSILPPKPPPTDWAQRIRDTFQKGKLPSPELAAAAGAVLLCGWLSHAEVMQVRTLAESLPWVRAHPAAARQTCYVSREGTFRRRLPALLTKLYAAVRSADATEQWGALSGNAPLTPRVIEVHRLSPGHDILDKSHYDHGSVVTVDVMLSPAGEFNGGLLQTVEPVGEVKAHELACGDALVFLSHKQHYVAPVERGLRHVLILELWDGTEKTCGHRCSSREAGCCGRDERL